MVNIRLQRVVGGNTKGLMSEENKNNDMLKMFVYTIYKLDNTDDDLKNIIK